MARHGAPFMAAPIRFTVAAVIAAAALMGMSSCGGREEDQLHCDDGREASMAPRDAHPVRWPVGVRVRGQQPFYELPAHHYLRDVRTQVSCSLLLGRRRAGRPQQRDCWFRLALPLFS